MKICRMGGTCKTEFTVEKMILKGMKEPRLREDSDWGHGMDGRTTDTTCPAM